MASQKKSGEAQKPTAVSPNPPPPHKRHGRRCRRERNGRLTAITCQQTILHDFA
ncbi:MAG: hypothetical protein R3C62_23565 [Chloroflexota bacterium]